MVGKRLSTPIQIEILKKRFTRLNPESDPQEIDWEMTVDANAIFDENLVGFQLSYPQYKWEDKNGDDYFFQVTQSIKNEADQYGLEVVDKGFLNRVQNDRDKYKRRNGELQLKMANMSKLVEKKKRDKKDEPERDIIDLIIRDIHDVNIVLNAINAHGKSSSLRTIIARLKEREPNSIIKVFDISQAWFHNAPVKYRQRITPDAISKQDFLNINDCVYEIGSLTKDWRRVFIAWIVNQDYQSRYNMGLLYGLEAVKKLPMIFYVFEEATNYFGSWSLKKNDPSAPVLYDFITVGRNYGLRSFLVVTREIGSLSTDIRDISPKILGHIEAKSDLAYYKGKNKDVYNLIKRMPKYHWVYYFRTWHGPFRIEDLVKNTPEDYTVSESKSYPWKNLPTGKVARAETRRPTVEQPGNMPAWKWILFLALLALAWFALT